MKQDISYGIIPLHFQDGKWDVLIVQHKSGDSWWGFPKGHAEEEESPQETAARELSEETGLTISRFLSNDPLTETYIFTFQKELISKTVQYFLALVEGDIQLQENEIVASQWLPLDEAEAAMTFEEGKRICRQIQEFVKAMP